VKPTLLIVVLSSIVGCTPALAPKPPLNLPNPQAIAIKPVELKVLTGELCRPTVEAAEDGVMFALDATGYKNLAENLKGILNFMMVQNEIIKKYQEYYEKKPAKVAQ
jgi:hypothetical protein